MKKSCVAKKVFQRLLKEKYMKEPQIPEQAYKALIVAANDGHPISNLEQLGVNQRMINILQSNNINEINDLLQMKKEELLSLNNFGERQMKVLFEALSKYHLIQVGS